MILYLGYMLTKQVPAVYYINTISVLCNQPHSNTFHKPIDLDWNNTQSFCNIYLWTYIHIVLLVHDINYTVIQNA